MDSVLAIARGHMPPDLAQEFLPDDMIIFTRGKKTNRSAHDRDSCPYCELQARTWKLTVSVTLTTVLALAIPHMLPVWLGLVSPVFNWLLWLSELSFILFVVLVSWAFQRSPMSMIRAGIPLFSKIDFTLYFAWTIDGPSFTQRYCRVKKIPIGSVGQRLKELEDGWIVMRLAPWPTNGVGSPGYEATWPGRVAISILRWFISRWRYWKRCTLGVHLHERVLSGELAAPIECRVGGLERATLRRERDTGRLLFVELNLSAHWQGKDESGTLGLGF
jgi:hypothetical protein